MTKKKYNWAILGCGKIARKFSSDLKLLPNARLYAAAARDFTRAQEFAAEFGFEKAYGSYEEMVADPAVDIVYVATPHSTIDLGLPTGAEIPIEQRDPEEIRNGFGRRTAPADCPAYNPAFDVTPADLITGIITEKGIIERPTTEKVAKHLLG